MKLSHIQLKVRDIHKAVEDYRKLGFNVDWGRDPKKSTNAFIWFGKDVFIEIFSMEPTIEKMAQILGFFYGKGMKSRWKKWSCREEKLIDFALEGKTAEKAALDNLSDRREEIIRSGINCSKILTGTRKPPDKKVTKFGFFAPEIEELPFMVSAYTVNQKPVESNHPNGASRIKWMKVQCRKEHEKIMKSLVGNDKQVILVSGDKTMPCSICFEGIKNPLNVELLHGLKVEY